MPRNASLDALRAWIHADEGKSLSEVEDELRGPESALRAARGHLEAATKRVSEMRVKAAKGV